MKITSFHQAKQLQGAVDALVQEMQYAGKCEGRIDTILHDLTDADTATGEMFFIRRERRSDGSMSNVYGHYVASMNVRKVVY